MLCSLQQPSMSGCIHRAWKPCRSRSRGWGSEHGMAWRSWMVLMWPSDVCEWLCDLDCGAVCVCDLTLLVFGTAAGGLS